MPRHPSSVTLGIKSAGIGVMCVQEEGASARTKAREPVHTVAFVDDSCAHYLLRARSVADF
jgi:hypothetical protein